MDRYEGGQRADGEAFQRAARARPFRPNDVVQGHAWDVLTDDVGLVARDVRVQDLCGAEPGDALGDFEFPHESRSCGLVPCEPSVQQLDGDVVLGGQVTGRSGGAAEEDGALPALAQTAEDLVPAQRGRVARPQWMGVRHRPVRHATLSPSLPALGHDNSASL